MLRGKAGETRMIFDTPRLRLRPFERSDAKDVQLLAGDYDVAKMVPPIPRPYPDGAAESWIDYVTSAAEQGKEFAFAVVHKEQQTLLGCVGLHIDRNHQRAELGYWIGRAHWNQGFVTEAAARILQHAFEDLKLHRLYANIVPRNTGSVKVAKKLGMRFEGTLRQHIFTRGNFEDVCVYGKL